MKIINVEAYPIYPRFAERNQDKLVRFRQINHRSIVKIETDNGIVGYGDYRQGPPTAGEIEPLIDRNPFDFVHNDFHMAIGGALSEDMVKEVERAAEEGYRIFKMHTCEHYDVFEQNRAVEEVAPEGFKMQWDFNSNRDLATVLPIVKELEKSRVLGFVEDPLVRGMSRDGGGCGSRPRYP